MQPLSVISLKDISAHTLHVRIHADQHVSILRLVGVFRSSYSVANRYLSSLHEIRKSWIGILTRCPYLYCSSTFTAGKRRNRIICRPLFLFVTYSIVPIVTARLFPFSLTFRYRKRRHASIETASSAFNRYSYYSNLLDQWTLHKQTNRFHSGPSLLVFCSYFYRMCRRVILYANELSTRRQYKKSKLSFVQLLCGKCNSIPFLSPVVLLRKGLHSVATSDKA